MPFTRRLSVRFLSIEATWMFGIIKIDFAEGCWNERKDQGPMEVGFSICQTPRNLLNCFSACNRRTPCHIIEENRGEEGSVATLDVRLVLQLVCAWSHGKKLVAMAA